MSSAPIVKVSVGQFDYMSTEREAQVHVLISRSLRSSYYLPADMVDQLRPLPWPELVRTAHAYWAARVFIDTSRAQKEALAEWLAVDENEAALYEAWRQDQIRRHPVAAALAAEVEKLRAQVAERVQVPAYVYRAETDGIPLGTYLNVEDAHAHCEDALGTVPTPVGWYEEDAADPDEPTTLRLYFDHGDYHTPTGYAVVPVPLLATYDPEADS